MLRKIAEKCTLILLKHNVISENQKAVYIYGFELFWSTFLSAASILILGLLFGYTDAAVIFLLFFMPIRMAVGGYHAKSYGTCFLLTNGIAFLCVCVASWAWNIGGGWATLILWLAVIVSFTYIWRMSPVNLEKYSHIIVVVELVGVIIMKTWLNSYVVYTALTATCAVALMINVAKRKVVRA